MAVDKGPRQANHFWPSFYQGTILLISAAQLTCLIAVSLAIVYIGEISPDSGKFWIITGIIVAVNLITDSLLFIHTAKPTRELMSAIIHMLGQQSNLVVPEMNTKKNDRTGFGDALKLIFGLSTVNSKPQIESAEYEAVKLELSALTDMLNTTSCGIVTLNSDRKITYANSSAPTRTNSEGSKELNLIFNGSDTLESWIDNCDETAVRSEHVWTRMSNSLPSEENRRFFDVIASYQKGKIAETVLVFIDRTSLYSVDEENLDFLSFAAHELRGPITVIRGYLDVLEDELENTFVGDQHELFSRLIVSSNRLSGYIDNILNTSRYDRRHLKVNLSESTITAVYDVISDDMSLRAGSQNRLLATNFPTDLPTIAVDVSSMSEVLGNLIDNAIKYSNEGGAINVTAVVNGDYVDVSVQDHGIGMPESVVSNLFQKFYRSHRSRETVAGTGIGLYISKAIVESHGGRISVRSEDGRGSTFVISIPIYSTVADKLQSGDNSNEGLISEGKGWIKNHSMYRS